MAGLRVTKSKPVEQKHGILHDLGVVEERATELSALFELSNGILSTLALVEHESTVCGLGAGTHGGEVGGLLVGLSDELFTLLGDDGLSEFSASSLEAS